MDEKSGSRKLKGLYASMGAVFLLTLLAAAIAAVADVSPTGITGICTLYGLFVGGNYGEHREKAKKTAAVGGSK